MIRKKMNLAWIANDSDRKACLQKRRDGMCKKVNELSIICDVSVVVIVYRPEDTKSIIWHIPSKVQEILARFNDMLEMEQTKKMINQKTYMQGRVSKLDD
ncbi:hypothetical protein Dsin_000236 [Dipteronia sinensis]|uniref:MADS-box domain-containing protein n=1 Tax=Dipteronia sinensis TaxID=43782 RepID=A0AAE0EJ78_9ROSI|nr:hypothetical protein Dsin_000236 [Dipteronia sinensis]